MIDRVRRYHKLGHKANDQGSSSEKTAALHGVGISTARKAKDFARKYSESEVEALLRLRRSTGLPLHWGHVWFLLTVPCPSSADKGSREKLQAEAAKKDWTATQLYRQIKRRFSRNRRWTFEDRGVGGRKHRGEPGSPEFLQSLIESAGRLTRGLEQLDSITRSRSHSKELESCLTALEQTVRRVRRELVD